MQKKIIFYKNLSNIPRHGTYPHAIISFMWNTNDFCFSMLHYYCLWLYNFYDYCNFNQHRILHQSFISIFHINPAACTIHVEENNKFLKEFFHFINHFCNGLGFSYSLNLSCPQVVAVLNPLMMPVKIF